ncbi:MAG: glycosyltransferase family 9 protein [Chloroflexi bacterium]|nr:glycosyltransferase family 9 protein [Chloroflexota bacterium]
MKRILVVKLADLGDLLTATPALRALRNAHPTAHIGALVTPSSASLLAGSDAVDEILPFHKAAFDQPLAAGRSAPAAVALARRLRAGRWDALVLLHHLTTPFGIAKYAALCHVSGAPIRAGLDNGRGWFLTRRVDDPGFGGRHEVDHWLAVASLLGGVNPSPRLEVPVTADDRAWADATLRMLGRDGAETAVFHPGSGGFSLARRWPAERFGMVAGALERRTGLRPLVLYGPAPDEEVLARCVAVTSGVPANLCGPAPSPGALVALLERVRMFVGNDSGVMHLAVTAAAPVVAIFGPTNDRAWGPYPLTSPRHAVVRETLACAPCIHRGHSFGTPQGCEARTCLDSIEPADVLAVVDRVLAATADERQPALAGAAS